MLYQGCYSAPAAPTIIYVTTPTTPSSTHPVATTTSTSSKYCAGFTDVLAKSAECAAINNVVKAGIFSGYANGTFGPAKSINRAEASKVITTGWDYKIVSAAKDATGGFRDTEKGSWYMPYLLTAKNNSIVKGYPDLTFKPANNITKAEFVKMVLAAAKVDPGACKVAPFKDIPGEAWYLTYLCYANNLGIIYGDSRNFFFPDTAITRGEVADILARALEKGIVE